MRQSMFCFLFLSLLQWASGQNSIKKHVQEKTIPVQTLSPDTAYGEDLDAIGNAIGDARIVMLGEQDHGDAPSFLAKTRLIRYLHEKKGFNVLAFESDFFGLNEGLDRLNKTPDSISQFIRRNIFPIWTGCHTCLPLFKQIIPDSWKTKQPLIVTGVDNQLILDFSRRSLVPLLDSVLQSAQLPITREPYYRTELLAGIDSMKNWYGRVPADTIWYGRTWTHLNTLYQQAAQHFAPHDFWMQVIENLRQEYLSFRSSQKEYRFASNNRDFQMAENLKWLLRYKYPKEKIIVWAASYHIARFEDSLPGRYDRTIHTMGAYFSRDPVWKDSTYILGFSSGSGKAGRLGQSDYTVGEPKKGSFETWINEGYEYAFTDFLSYRKRGANKGEQFNLKGFGHLYMKTDWTTVFDGVFFIRRMYPCSK